MGKNEGLNLVEHPIKVVEHPMKVRTLGLARVMM